MSHVSFVRAAVAALLLGGLAAGPGAAQTPPLAAPPDAVRIGGGVQIPARTKYVAPEYADALRQAGVRGTVNVEVLISPAGTVQDARVVKSIPQLDPLALDAVRQWEFEPTVVNGRAVPLILTLNVPFPPKPAPGVRTGGAATGGAAPAPPDSGAAQRAPGTGRNAADEKAIMMLRSMHDAAVAARAVDGILGHYADDALLMPPGEATIAGKAAIRGWLAKGTLPSPGNIALDIEVVGDLAFYRADPSGPGAPAARTPADQVRVMWLLAKQGDGSWKIAVAMWNAVK